MLSNIIEFNQIYQHDTLVLRKRNSCLRYVHDVITDEEYTHWTLRMVVFTQSYKKRFIVNAPKKKMHFVLFGLSLQNT